MPTAKEYRRLAREDDKHRILFRGMARWKDAQERDEDFPGKEPVLPGKQTVTFGVSDRLDGLRIAIPQGIIDRIDPASHRTESIGYLQNITFEDHHDSSWFGSKRDFEKDFVKTCEIHGPSVGQCKQCFRSSEDE